MTRLLLIVLALSLVAGCGRQPPAQPKPHVSAAHPIVRRVVDWDDYVGQFVAVDSVDVRPRVSGYLQTIGFRDGDIVKKGQVLFIIDPRPYQAALDQARGQEAHAEAAALNAKTESARGQSPPARPDVVGESGTYEPLVARPAPSDISASKREAGRFRR